MMQDSNISQDLSKAQQVLDDEILKIKQDTGSGSNVGESVAQMIANNESLITQLTSLVNLANELGQSKGAQNTEDVSDLIPVTIKALIAKGIETLDANEQLLIKLFRESRSTLDKKLVLPGWYKYLNTTMNSETKSNALPYPEQCAVGFESHDPAIQELLSMCDRLGGEYRTLREEVSDLQGKKGPDGTETAAVKKKLDAKRAEVSKALINLKVDPANIAAYRKAANFYLSFNDKTYSQISQAYHELGQFIVELLNPDEKGDIPLEAIPSRIIWDNENNAGFELEKSPISESISRSAMKPFLPDILKAYVSMRQVVALGYTMQAKAAPPKDSESIARRRQLQEKAVNSLRAVFPCQSDQTMSALMLRINEGNIRDSLRNLIFSKSVGDRPGERAGLFITDGRYASFLPEAMEAILNGDDQLLEDLRSSADTVVVRGG